MSKAQKIAPTKEAQQPPKTLQKLLASTILVLSYFTYLLASNVAYNHRTLLQNPGIGPAADDFRGINWFFAVVIIQLVLCFILIFMQSGRYWARRNAGLMSTGDRTDSRARIFEKSYWVVLIALGLALYGYKSLADNFSPLSAGQLGGLMLAVFVLFLTLPSILAAWDKQA